SGGTVSRCDTGTSNLDTYKAFTGGTICRNMLICFQVRKKTYSCIHTMMHTSSISMYSTFITDFGFLLENPFIAQQFNGAGFPCHNSRRFGVVSVEGIAYGVYVFIGILNGEPHRSFPVIQAESGLVKALFGEFVNRGAFFIGGGSGAFVKGAVGVGGG